MASGVATVWVPLDDMNRAVRFYGETLGLDVKTEGDDWTEFDANGDVSMIRWNFSRARGCGSLLAARTRAGAGSRDPSAPARHVAVHR